jgi:GntR family transcriptional regulator
VRQAVERLTRDGLVSPQRGRGTFVTGAPSNDRWLRVETSLRSLADVYRDTHPTILNIDESTRSPRLDESDGSRRRSTSTCAASMRTRAARTASSTSTSTPRSSRAIRRRFRKETVIPLLMAMPSVKIVAARQVLTISTADLEVARHLQISVNAPVADVRRVFTGRGGA